MLKNQDKEIFNIFKLLNENMFYFDKVAKFIIVMGIYFHVTGIFIGLDLFQEKIFTLTLDKYVILIFCYAIIGLIYYYKSISFSSKLQQFSYLLLAFWVAISIPIHIMGQINGTTSFIEGFPSWYSYFFLAIFLFLYYNFNKIKFQDKH